MVKTEPNTVKITAIGGDVGIIFTPEMLAKLGAKAGDTLAVVVTPTGMEIKLDRASVVAAIADRVMREDREVLRRLAE